MRKSTNFLKRSQLDEASLRDFLEEKTTGYNSPSFIKNDPVSTPHLFRKKEDREIAGFLAATIAWGQRPVIISNSNKLMQLMQMQLMQMLLMQMMMPSFYKK